MLLTKLVMTKESFELGLTILYGYITSEETVEGTDDEGPTEGNGEGGRSCC